MAEATCKHSSHPVLPLHPTLAYSTDLFPYWHSCCEWEYVNVVGLAWAMPIGVPQRNGLRQLSAFAGVGTENATVLYGFRPVDGDRIQRQNPLSVYFAFPPFLPSFRLS